MVIQLLQQPYVDRAVSQAFMLEYWYFLTFDKIIVAIFWQKFENSFDHYRKNDKS